ncbi:MAG: TadE family protein [Acetivibrionales bacterium]
MERLKATNPTKGSISVEASIIIPVIILTVTAVVYMAVFWFSHSGVRAVAGKAAERGAESWHCISSTITTGKRNIHSMGREKLYWRLYDSDKELKLKKVEEYALDEFYRYSIIKPLNVSIDAEVREYVIYKKIFVTIECTYRVPAAGLLKIFGFKDTYMIKAQGEAVVNDQPEFLRNTDFIVDLERELENKYPGLKDFADKLRSTLNNTKQKIRELIK